MRQHQSLIDTLKKQLKAAGFTYAKIAEHIDLSEASIKRIFALKKMSMQRLEELCDLIQLDIEELVRINSQQQRQTSSLSLKQEQKLSQNRELLLLAVCLMNHWSVADIRATYEINNLIKLLNELDAMKIIEVLPHDRVKLLVSRNFAWIKNGPIQHFFNTQVQSNFLASGFNQASQHKLFRVGMLSPESRNKLIEKLEKVAREFNDLHELDSHLPVGKRNGSGIMLAIRDWEFSVFKDMRRNA